MNVFIFSHGSDIDGMGGVILSKLAFEKVDYRLCEIANLNERVNEFIDNNQHEYYERVFITDLSLNKETLDRINNNKSLREKFKLLDHHESAKPLLDEYSFCISKIEDNNKKTCGTSLMYSYLLDNHYLEERKSTSDFVEDVRQEDNWEFQKYNNYRALDLDSLFRMLGADKYIEKFSDKLKENKYEFDEIDKSLIEVKQLSVKQHVNKYINKIHDVEILNHKGALIFIDYEYRNDIGDYIKKNTDYEFSMLVCFDKGTISFRSGKTNCNVRKIAEYLGGGGHDLAAASPIKNQDNIIEILTRQQ